MLKYRPDPDLAFLATCSSDQLARLVTLCVADEKGQPRMGRSLTFEPEFNTCSGDYRPIWDLIAAEIQRFGADTLMSLLRGGMGVLYREIVTDVASAIKAEHAKQWSIERREDAVVEKLFSDAFEKMTDAQKADFAAEMEEQLGALSAEQKHALLRAAKLESLKGLTPVIAYGIMTAGVKFSGFFAYRMLVIGLNAIGRALLGRTLTVAGNALATRAAGAVFGPIGWVIAAASAVTLLTGPAYRVTIPAVLQIALIRKEHLAKILERTTNEQVKEDAANSPSRPTEAKVARTRTGRKKSAAAKPKIRNGRSAPSKRGAKSARGTVDAKKPRKSSRKNQGGKR